MGCHVKGSRQSIAHMRRKSGHWSLIYRGTSWLPWHVNTRGKVLAIAGGLAVAMSALTGVAQAATVPGPPLDARGIYTDFQAERVTVGWTPPIDDGGAFITAYRVQASRDGVTWVATEDSACDPPAPDQQCFPELTVVFSYTLTIYETYVFRVAAFNSSGWGAWSAL